MELLYIAALVFGAGALGVQLFMGGDSGHGDAGGHDAHPALGGGEHAHGDHAHAGDSHAGLASAVLVLLSLRFWVFAAFAFGLTGTAIRMLGLASPLLALLLALAAGLGAGALAVWVFRALARSESSSAVAPDDLIGQLGRVLVPLAPGATGKVRLELRGQAVDMLATTDDVGIGAGELVLVEAVREHTLHVSRPPAELALGAAPDSISRLPG
jgi:membrane protein implicated in regulation of membrane protease activity